MLPRFLVQTRTGGKRASIYLLKGILQRYKMNNTYLELFDKNVDVEHFPRNKTLY